MTKRSSTVHLEESTWDEIAEYQEQYGCNRNEAIERMFVERRIILNMNNSTMNKTSNFNIEKENSTDSKDKDDEISKAMESVYNEMPE